MLSTFGASNTQRDWQFDILSSVQTNGKFGGDIEIICEMNIHLNNSCMRKLEHSFISNEINVDKQYIIYVQLKSYCLSKIQILIKIMMYGFEKYFFNIFVTRMTHDNSHIQTCVNCICLQIFTPRTPQCQNKIWSRLLSELICYLYVTMSDPYLEWQNKSKFQSVKLL